MIKYTANQIENSFTKKRNKKILQKTQSINCSLTESVKVFQESRSLSNRWEKVKALFTCKTSYPQAVGGVQLFQQEFTAGLPDILHLQNATRGEQNLHVVGRYDYLSGVRVFYEQLYRRGVHLVKDHLVAAMLLHVPYGRALKWREYVTGAHLPLNIAKKYELTDAKTTLWALNFSNPTFSVTSHNYNKNVIDKSVNSY